MYLTIIILLFILMIICAAADLIEEFWPSPAIKIVKPIVFVAFLILSAPIVDFMCMMIDVDAIVSFMSTTDPMTGSHGFLEFIQRLFF